jgi:GntR family transcriptional regulator / MocR family aminotransferase
LRHLDYSDTRGLPELRRAIAEHVSVSRATRCSPDQVIVTSGAQAGMEFISRLLLDIGEGAYVEDPGYVGIQTALIATGATIVRAPVDEEGLDVDAIASKKTPARLVYVSPSHQFPLGITMSLSRRYALLDWACRSNAWILEDDYDSEFRYGAGALPCLHGLDPDGRVIYVGTFSKTLFPGLRLVFW